MTVRLPIAVAMLTLGTPCFAAEPAPPTAFDHLAIYVADLNRSTAFYRKLFGFTDLPAPVPFARWMSMGQGKTLHIVGGRKQRLETTRWDHFSISCRDLARMIADIEAAGLTWSNIEGQREVQTRADGVKQIFVQDPDGYWIEINDALKQ